LICFADQGDKLMRLMSVVPTSFDLIRGMSGLELPEDGAGQCISADDYLSPEDMAIGNTSPGFQTLISVRYTYCHT